MRHSCFYMWASCPQLAVEHRLQQHLQAMDSLAWVCLVLYERYWCTLKLRATVHWHWSSRQDSTMGLWSECRASALPVRVTSMSEVEVLQYREKLARLNPFRWWQDRIYARLNGLWVMRWTRRLVLQLWKHVLQWRFSLCPIHRLKRRYQSLEGHIDRLRYKPPDHRQSLHQSLN